MNPLISPTNPTQAYHAQLAALCQLGSALVKSVPHGVSTSTDVALALHDMTCSILKLEIALLKEDLKT